MEGLLHAQVLILMRPSVAASWSTPAQCCASRRTSAYHAATLMRGKRPEGNIVQG